MGHVFWDKQWVGRGYKQLGVLKRERPPLEITRAGFSNSLKNSQVYVIDTLDTEDDLQLDKAIQFLDQHFLKHYLNTPELLKWLMNPKPIGNLILKDNTTNEWLGTISTRDMLCRVEKTIYPLGYVDFLSVHQKHRKNGLAIRLIGSTLEKYHRTSFVFKKEDRPLPFDYVCEFQYFSLVIRTDPMAKNYTQMWIDQPDVSMSYQLYSLIANQFAISEAHSLESWKKFVFTAPLIHCYAKLDRERVGQYTDFLSFFVYRMKMGHKTVRVAEILYLCCRNPKKSVSDSLEAFEFFARQKGCEILVANTMGHLSQIDKIPRWMPSKKTYLHFYNLGVKKRYPSSQVLLT